MSAAPRLPTVRLPTVIAGAGGESSPQDPFLLDLPPSGKFGFAWPADTGPAPSLPSSLADRHTSLSSSDADSAPSEHETETEENAAAAESLKTRRWSTGAGRKGHGEELEESDFATPTHRLNLDKNPLDQASPPLPRLSRAFSVPLSSQIGHLRNPMRTPLPTPPDSLPPSPQLSPDLAHFHDLSLELADSAQMVIQTLLQYSPPQVFDPAKEHISACALPIPTPSVSALFTVMKSLNYMSSHMATFSTPLPSRSRDPSSPTINDDPCSSATSNEQLLAPQASVHDFDIGETLQNVGDALGGMAAELGVELVLYHGDVGMKHIAVKGDEIGILYTLSHIVRQILAAAHRGDCVQIGLFLVAPVVVSPKKGDPSVFEVPLDATEPADAISLPDPDSPLRCTFQITQIFAHNIAGTSAPLSGTTPVRGKPYLDSHILHRLVRHVNATLTCEPTDTAPVCKLSVTLERGSPAVVNPAIILSDNDPLLQSFPDFKLSEEPTLEDLAQFVGTLKGKKVSLYADAAGIFAHHLTSYLTSWGLDVSHASSESDAENSPCRESMNLSSAEHPPVTNEALGGGTILQTLDEQESPPSAPLTPKSPSQSPSFILIDDDISVLRERLGKLRAELPHPSQFARKRPNLAANHRPRSSPQVARAIGQSSTTSSPRSVVVIIHFTSLGNFKLVKGILQSVLGPSNGTPGRLPEVIVIPKPAGPRRVLTALHTAITKPIVDPFFSPIATSPISPGLYPAGSYFHQHLSPKSPMSRPSSSPRAYSYQSMHSPRADVEPTSDVGALPPSPLGLTEGMDYFSEAAEKLGSSPSSGLVIQSPSGHPAGIFFHPPRARNSRRSSQSVTVENGTAYSRGSRRHSDSAERTRTIGGVTFLNLPGPVQARRSSPISQVSIDAGRSGSAVPSTAISGGDTPATTGMGHLESSPGARQVAKRTGAIEALRRTASPPLSPRTSPAASAKLSSSRWGSSGMRRTPTEKAASPSPMRKAKPAEPSIVPPISVLIVEDNPINQTLLSTFMRKKKIKYDVAKNGEEAVEKWKSGRFHLILMDIQMPVMDGISATKEIRRLEKLNSSHGYPGTPQTEGQRTPSDVSNDSRMSTSPFRSSVIIVALTASSLQSDRVAALAAGCNDFLTKPVSLEWLNNKIIEWGSIKALQMFADSRPDFVKSVSAGQTVQAQNIARRLHMPEGRVSPSPSRPLSQPVVSGVISTTVSGSSASGSDDPTLAGIGNSTPSLIYKSFDSIQEGSSGTPELHHGGYRKFFHSSHDRSIYDA
ncbi:hypothetical protein F5148DRAFT_973098 [Russula earlei]|uniref:Uncharacterized protein n=1 Tax=Russula earlei TaxID=71964 RepID=A0ACC0UN15_9AGAM|nr:hypothetical protein F5148DRAFT_973098 [Russula earlei]